MTVDKMTVDKMTVHKKMTIVRQNYCWQSDST